MSGKRDTTSSSGRRTRILQISWTAAIVLSIALGVGILATGSSARSASSIPKSGVLGHAVSAAKPASGSKMSQASKAAIETDLVEFKSAAAVKAFEDAPGRPACKAPAIPAPTYPPGNTYGVPFLAAITNGELIAGYDEWTANNNVWNTGSKTIHLYPWQSKIFDITGWVTGLIQLPSLSASIPPQDVVFCDQGGPTACLGANPPAECIRISSQFGPAKGAKTPPPPITNVPGSGNPCTPSTTGHPSCPCSSTPSCLAFYLTLTPVGNSTLSVTGVEPDGSLELSVKTSAVTNASLNTLACQNKATTVTLSTQVPTGLPPSAPVTPTAGNTDYRGLRTTPAVLTGPLDRSTSTLVGNDFSVPAFLVNQPTANCTITLTTLLNTYAGGWGLGYGGGNGFGQGLYYQDGGDGAIVAPPGWGQFSATTTVVSLGLPTGPPPDFNF
jgi:hypothetical protein